MDNKNEYEKSAKVSVVVDKIIARWKTTQPELYAKTCERIVALASEGKMAEIMHMLLGVGYIETLAKEGHLDENKIRYAFSKVMEQCRDELINKLEGQCIRKDGGLYLMKSDIASTVNTFIKTLRSNIAVTDDVKAAVESGMIVKDIDGKDMDIKGYRHKYPEAKP